MWREFLQALLEWVGPWLERWAVYRAGKLIAQGRVAEDELHKVEAANAAAAANRARPVADRLRDANERGLYRLRDAPADAKR